MNTLFHRTAAPDATIYTLTRPGPLWRRADGPAGMAWAALLALAYACWLFSPLFLRGHGAFWLQENADVTQYVAGFNAYVREAWHWPLLRITSLNAPEGTLATFTDAIPLYAMLLKLIQHGPDTPMRNPYGIWIALCFLLQGVGAWWICREARVRSWVTLTAMAMLLASFPALTFRISHTSLMSQWLLVFAIAIYLRSSRLSTLAVKPWLILVPCAFYINVYLFAMLSAIFAADVLRHVRRDNLRPLGVMAGAYALLVLTMCVTMLPMGPGGGAYEWGFGYYSMNLLAPINGGNLLKIPHPVAHDGQGEGFNYVGLAVLATFTLAWGLRTRRDPRFLRRHAILGVMLVLLTVFAVSNTGYFGAIHVYDLKLADALDPITATFRSSGRFFWPVGYAIIVFTVVSVHRYLNARRAAALLALLVVAQLVDLQDHHAHVRATINPPATPPLDTARWDAFLGKDTRELLFYPPFRCGTAPPSHSLLPTMLYATRRGYALSTGYIARAHRPCEHYDDEIATRLKPGTAVVFDMAEFTNPEQIRRLLTKAPPTQCVAIDFAYLCRLGRPDRTEGKQ